MNKTIPGLIAILSALYLPNASAQWRCDCTTIVDSCTASVVVETTAVEVRSEGAQCARVDYFIDGIPFVALVVDGVERQDWLTRSENPDILVQSCQVCVDNADALASTTTAAPTTNDGPLAALIEVDPQYPPAALAAGVEGFVEVSYSVTPFGQVEGVRVTNSEPAGTFDQAAVSAIMRWRYPSDESRASTALTHRFDFAVADSVFAIRSASPRPAATSGRARNACLREQASYNYGELVEVDLINACAEPLVVFSCAEGTGRVAGRWVCQNMDAGRSTLVQPGDGRTGSATNVATSAGLRPYEYRSDFSVTRAPNSEYWWLACGLQDTSCREQGAQWVDAIDRQAASLNPQDRTARQLARSY